MNWRKVQISRLLLVVCALVLLPAMIGSFSSCMLCDSDPCCDDSDCADIPCCYACAFCATSSLLAPATPALDACGYIADGHFSSIPQEPLRDLYRPPRSSVRA